MDKKCRIELFNGLQVWRGDRHIARFRTRKAALLLARLALEPRFHERALLVEWLWPDCSLVVGRNRLSVTLSALRRDFEALGAPPLFIATHDVVSLDFTQLTTDVAEFEAALRRLPSENPSDEAARLASAVEKWAGPLLEGYDDDHFTAHKQRLRDQFSWSVCRLAEILLRESLPSTATGADFIWSQLRRASQEDPTDEALTRASLQILAMREGPTAALRHYYAFEALLRSETGECPDPATQQLARELQDQLNQSSSFADSGAYRPQVGNRFFGRGRELTLLLDELSAALNVTPSANGEGHRDVVLQGRLFCLTGSGGVGKTRLALEVARRLSALSPQSLFFVPLASLSDAARLPDAILDALGLSRDTRNPLWQTVLAALRSRPTLLILDNFEHLLEAGTASVQKLLEDAPRTVCLLTSQRRLGIQGEREIVVTALPVPSTPPENLARRETEAVEAAWLQALEAEAAVQLFFDRARGASRNFRLHRGNAGAISQLCRALEGVPLAIELAAARSALLSPAQMLDALHTRLDFLRSRPEHAANFDARHLSMRAALEWSFALLPPDLKRLLPQLAVFRGGWTLESAASVGSAPPKANPLWYLEAHETLHQHSLLLPQDFNGAANRFFFLETVRQFAAEKLSKGDKRRLEERHARYFVALAEDAARQKRGPHLRIWLELIESETDNLRAALDWALRRDATLALRFAAALWWFWFLGGMVEEGRNWLSRALEAVDAMDSPPNDEPFEAYRAEALCGAGFLAWRQGDFAAAEGLSRQSLELFRASGDQRGQVYSLLPLQMACMTSGDYETGFALATESARLCHLLSDQFGLAFSLHIAGGLHELTGDLAAAMSLQEQSLALFRLTSSREGEAYALFNWGSAARRSGEWARARELCMQSQTIFDALANREGAAHCALQAALTWPEPKIARSALQKALGELRELGAKWGVALALEGLAMSAAPLSTKVEVSAAEISRATRWWSAAQQLREQIGAPVPPVDKPTFAAFEAALRRALSPSSFDAAWQLGRAFTLEQIVDEALQVETPFIPHKAG